MKRFIRIYIGMFCVVIAIASFLAGMYRMDQMFAQDVPLLLILAIASLFLSFGFWIATIRVK